MTTRHVPASPHLCDRCDSPAPPSQRGSLTTGEILDGPAGTTWQVSAVTYPNGKWEPAKCATCGRFMHTLAAEYTLVLASGEMPDGTTAIVTHGRGLTEHH